MEEFFTVENLLTANAIGLVGMSVLSAWLFGTKCCQTKPYKHAHKQRDAALYDCVATTRSREIDAHQLQPRFDAVIAPHENQTDDEDDDEDEDDGDGDRKTVSRKRRRDSSSSSATMSELKDTGSNTDEGETPTKRPKTSKTSKRIIVTAKRKSRSHQKKKKKNNTPNASHADQPLSLDVDVNICSEMAKSLVCTLTGITDTIEVNHSVFPQGGPDTQTCVMCKSHCVSLNELVFSLVEPTAHRNVAVNTLEFYDEICHRHNL